MLEKSRGSIIASLCQIEAFHLAQGDISIDVMILGASFIAEFREMVDDLSRR
jgi:hypothetical protein